MRKRVLIFTLLLVSGITYAQKKASQKSPDPEPANPANVYNETFKAVKWRNIGPFRGGRSVASSGVPGDPLTYYMGTTGGGLWKTTDAGVSWENISDGYFKTSSVGAVAVAESDPNVVYVGMGEHAPRGVMTSYGDGVYKSTDAGKTWKKVGLDKTRHISMIRIHPQNPDLVYVAAQGALHGPSEERGVYKSADGGATWKKVLYADENSGASDLSMDMTNPRILYAALWDHRRLPWQMVSGGPGSGLYKSVDGGENWTKLEKGLPREKGKMGISVSRANPSRVYAVIESDSEKEKGGVFRSDDAGKSWDRVSKDHRTIQRAWYYIEIIADPVDENTVYVLNSPALKSIDGGKTFSRVFNATHGDHHDLWINPQNNKNMVLSNDGGAAVSFNAGTSFSFQNGMPTAQFYRLSVDNRFPYRIYAGQQDNTSVMISSRNTAGSGITEREWEASAGGESAFLAFDPDAPRYVMGGSYQGTIELLDLQTKEGKGVMVSPIQYQAMKAKDMKYRFNWNAPILYSQRERAFYHAGNRLFKTTDLGKTWTAISPDLTRADTTKLGLGGAPYTNEGAGGENYATISYVVESPLEAGVFWVGSDDGLVHLTRDGGSTWTNVTPAGLDETLINSIEVSPHDKATAYMATTRYKVNDFRPGLYKTTDYGKSWTRIDKGIPDGAYTRVVREDDQRRNLLYAGTETGLYLSYDGGATWKPFQLNLPITPITDLKVKHNDLIAATMGRSIWILDDLAPIRQYQSSIPKDSLWVYKPENAYRVSGRSALDKTQDEEDESIGTGRSGSAGDNPATGVVFYYQLPAKPDTSQTLSLDILDAAGKIVRNYSSKEDEEFETYPGGPSPDDQLPIRGGMNRFVWDMRAESIMGVPKVFIEGSYDGRKMAPGPYRARFSYGKQQKSVDFTILPDPRIQASDADYQAQQSLLQALEQTVQTIHQSVLDSRKVRSQLTEFAKLAKEQPSTQTLADSAKALSGRLKSWEEKVVQNKSEANDDVINFQNRLSADYIFVRGELDSNVPIVTQGQKDRLTELDAQWETLKGEFQKLNQEVRSFNALCREKGIEKITIP